MVNTYAYDDELLKNNTIFLQGEINEQSVGAAIKKLLCCHSEFEKGFVPREKRVVRLVINSMGGEVRAGLVLLSFLKTIPVKIKTVCLNAASMAAVIAACGAAKGERFIVCDGSVMIHQPSTGVSGTITDAQIALAEGVKLKAKLTALLTASTSQPLHVIEENTSRDSWFTPAEAVKFGLVDTVISDQELFKEVFKYDV